MGGHNLYQYAPNPISWIDPWGLNKICSTISFPDGQTITLPDFKAPAGAKSIPGRTQDAEQQLLRYLRRNFPQSKLAGAVLDIKSQPTFIRLNGRTIPIQGVNPCPHCNNAMNSFARENRMRINYGCRKNNFSYPTG